VTSLHFFGVSGKIKNFSNWDETYRIALANELTGDRPWLGELHLVALFSKALSSKDILSHFKSGPNGEGTLLPPPDQPLNKSPFVDAGPEKAITLPDLVTLHGTATDDGLPSGQLTLSWAKLSGPGTVTFSDANALITSASFSQEGTYVLQLTASDGDISDTDEVTVTVQPALSLLHSPTLTSIHDHWKNHSLD